MFGMHSFLTTKIQKSNHRTKYDYDFRAVAEACLYSNDVAAIFSRTDYNTKKARGEHDAEAAPGCMVFPWIVSGIKTA